MTTADLHVADPGELDSTLQAAMIALADDVADLSRLHELRYVSARAYAEGLGRLAAKAAEYVHAADEALR